jgi:hypothetical protein
MIFVPYIYVICTVHLCYLYRTFMLYVPYIYDICTVHFLDYIKSRSDKCTHFIICYFIQFILKIVQHVSNYVSSSSGTQLCITPATDVQYSLKYKLVDKMSLNVFSLWSLYQLLSVHHLFVSDVLCSYLPLVLPLHAVYIWVSDTTQLMHEVASHEAVMYITGVQ